MTEKKNKSEIFKKLIKKAALSKISMVLVSNHEHNKNVKYSDYEIMIATGAEKSISANQDSNFFEILKNFINENNDWVFGHLGYDLKNYTEKLKSENPDYIKFPDGYFFVPENLTVYQNGKEIILKQKEKTYTISEEKKYSNDLEKNASTQFKLDCRLDQNKYVNIVNQIKKHIQRGDIFEINFCYEYFINEVKIDPVNVFIAINEISPMPFAGFYKYFDNYLLCFSPERYIKKIDNKVISQPMKGTVRRGKTDNEDRDLKKFLFENIKERTENIMITDLVRNDLSRTAKNGSVRVEELCGVYGFKQLNQMVSTISCEIDENTHPVDTIKNSFPMGSMTGAPKVKAMELIEKYEQTKRGLYSGSIGYFTPHKDYDFNVVIRSVCYNKIQKYLNFMVGSAITSLSDPEKEFEECQLKAKALFDWLEDIITVNNK